MQGARELVVGFSWVGCCLLVLTSSPAVVCLADGASPSPSSTGGMLTPDYRMPAPSPGPASTPWSASIPTGSPSLPVVPAGLSTALPVTGSLVHYAQARLRVDHHSLANVSQDLLAVQTEVAGMEQSLFGKVMNLEAVRTLYAQHDAIASASSKLQDDIERLSEQVEGLSAQLAVAQRSYISTGQSQHSDQMQLRTQIIQNQATTNSLAFEVERGKLVNAVHQRLSAERDRLLAESLMTARQGEAALRELADAHAAARKEASTHGPLQKALMEMRGVNVECHDHVEKESDDLKMAKTSAPKESVAATVAQQYAVASAQAAEQRLIAEGAILRDEIHGAETSGEHAFRSLQRAQIELKGLEESIITEIRNITSRIDGTKHQCEVTHKSLQENRGVGAADLARKHAVQVRVSTLQQQVSPVVLATLQAENEAYESELRHATVLLQQSKAAEAVALVAAQQLEVELGAQQGSAAAATKAVKQAQMEGERQLEVAVQDALARQADSAKVQAQAEAALAATCSSKWEKRQSDKDAEVQTCQQQKEELAVLQAQRDTLEQTLQAQQTAAAVG